MSDKTKDVIYVVLMVINAAMVALMQQNVLPEKCAHWVALGSFAVAAMLKQFSAFKPAPAAAPVVPVTAPAAPKDAP